MKTCAVLVLVAFITLGMELACTWRQPFIREGAEGILPGNKEGAESSFGPGDGLAHKQAVCPLQNGDLELIRPISFDLQERTPCISHSPFRLGWV